MLDFGRGHTVGIGILKGPGRTRGSSGLSLSALAVSGYLYFPDLWQLFKSGVFISTRAGGGGQDLSQTPRF